mmetsp:Transcript_10882/g.17117  ORF Transcript_10882/g.17117 Transcript_10882/m.17117 type:complete len:91 (+) Transcript_10882:468-740(+)
MCPEAGKPSRPPRRIRPSRTVVMRRPQGREQEQKQQEQEQEKSHQRKQLSQKLNPALSPQTEEDNACVISKMASWEPGARSLSLQFKFNQ